MLGLRGEHLDAEALAELGSKTAISDHLIDLAATQLEEREATFGEETWALVERAVLLRAIDTLWVDHLTELEDFRRGVGLRGYGGTDPLVEFKREAFKLYDELRGFIRHQVAATIFRVSVQRRTAAPSEPTEMPTLTPEQLAKLRAGAGCRRRVARLRPPSPRAAASPPRAGPWPRPSCRRCHHPATAARPMRLQHGDETVGTTAGAQAPRRSPPDVAHLGRNDPCWCGSGKKFKRCHGA